MRSREEALAANRLTDHMERMGITLKGTNGKRLTNRCGLTEHKPQHLCVSVDYEKQTYYCNDCQKGGSLIDFLMDSEGISVKEAMSRLEIGDDDVFAETIDRKFSRPTTRQPTPQPPREKEAQPSAPAKIVKTYDYTDSRGNLLYQVCRMEPKSFRQRHKNPDGSWNWKMEGVKRVLFNLPAVLKADFVWIVEGEKDAETLNALPGFAATCNVGGAGKWDASYSQCLKGKDVILCGDTDEPGQKHVEKVKEAISGIARTVAVMDLPPDFKDVSEFVATFETKEEAACAVMDIAARAEVLHGGYRIPIKSMAEMERSYMEFAKRVDAVSLSLGRFMPRLGNTLRPLVPGELVTFLAGTGVGKTMILQNLALHTKIATLMFELELPETLTFERFVGMERNNEGRLIAEKYRTGEHVPWNASGRLNHIHVCSESGLTVAQITDIIEKAGLKTGERPKLVLLDYVQIIEGSGKGSRYERASGVAEELKVMAKKTNTIVVVASQVGREHSGTGEKVTLFSGKDSGSIENSSGLVIGAWRDAENPRGTMWMQVLKNTKGNSGQKTALSIGADMTLTEEAHEREEPEGETTPKKPYRR